MDDLVLLLNFLVEILLCQLLRLVPRLDWLLEQLFLGLFIDHFLEVGENSVKIEQKKMGLDEHANEEVGELEDDRDDQGDVAHLGDLVPGDHYPIVLRQDFIGEGEVGENSQDSV